MGAADSVESVTVVVNGSPWPATVGSSLDDLIASLGFAGRPIAVEVDGEVVPRPALGGWRVAGGERIEIVTFVGGG